MTRLFFILITTIFVFACSSSVGPQRESSANHKLQITFQNISSHNLQNLVVAEKSLGTLPAKTSSAAIPFDNFGFDTGMVDEDMSVVVNGEEFNNYERGFWCGTEKVNADSGDYIVKIDINEYGLVVSCENAPTIFDNP